MAPPKSRRSAGRVSKHKRRKKKLLKSASGIYISAMLCFVLFVITVLMLIFCLQKWEKVRTFRRAVESVRSFVMIDNPNAHTMDDMAVIEECQLYVDELASWSRKIKELKSAILDIRSRLNRDWEAYEGFIYLFYEDRMIWNEAKMFCQKQGSHLVTIENKLEEEFIETRIRDTTVNYWAGGIKMSTHTPWKWIETESDLSTFDVFWAYGEPQEAAHMNCIVVKTKCPEHLKCWYSRNCFTFNRPVCKKRPEKTWFELPENEIT